MLSPSLGSELAQPVADIYQAAELRILERIAFALQAGISSPEWEVQQLGRLQSIRAEVLAELQVVNPEAARIIQDALNEAYTLGGLSAFQDVGTAAAHVGASGDQRALAVIALARETATGVTSAQGAILRSVDDVYRAVIGEAVSQVATGAVGRESAVQRALETFLGKGLTFIDTRRGRLNLGDYATMAVRTATARTALQGQVDTQQAMGLELTTIHPGPRACDICDRWARVILTTGRQTGKLRYRDLSGTGFVQVTVDATLAEARQAGWGHPNCRCALATFIPGVTRTEVIERPPWDAEAYKAQQQQRGIERQIRGWKTRQAIAVTPDAKAETQQRVKAWQGAMRNHLEQYPDLKRQSAREQITGNLGGNPTGARPLRSTPDAPPAPEPNLRDVRTMTNAERIEATRRIYGDDSPQLREARRRYR